MEEKSDIRKNPSRKACEDVIKRILMTEVLTKGRNEHFKQANDFMSYFQSLYPTSDSLAKQVQRAVTHLDLPKDEKGYLIINKSKSQIEEERNLSKLLHSQHASIDLLEQTETLLVKLDPDLAAYTAKQMMQTSLLQELFLTIIPTVNGLLFLTNKKEELVHVLNNMIN